MVQLKFSDKVSSMDSLAARIEGSAYFMKRLLFLIACNGLATSIPIYSIGYLTGVPKVACPNEDGQLVPVLPAEACLRRHECVFNYEFDSWTKKYDLVCERESFKNLCISLVCWIGSLGVLGGAFLIDAIGRKKVYWLATTVYLVGSILVFMTDSFLLKMLIISLMGACDVNLVNSCMILLTEISRKESTFKLMALSYSFMTYSLGPVILGLVTLFVSSADTLWIVLMVVFFAMMGGNYFFFVESPVFLYKKKRLEEMTESIKEIAAVNGVEIERPEILHEVKRAEDDVEEGTELVDITNPRKSDNYKDQLLSPLIEVETNPASPLPNCIPLSERNQNQGLIQVTPVDPQEEKAQTLKAQSSSFAFLVFALSVDTSAIYLLFYGLMMSIDSCGFDSMQLNAVMLGLSSFVGYRLVAYLNPYPRIKTKTLLYAAVFACTMANFALSKIFPLSEVAKITRSLLSMVAVNIILCGLFSIAFLYPTEIFPPERRGLGSGLSISFGRFMGGLAPYIKTYCLNAGIDPVLGFTIPSIAAVLIYQLLPETNTRRK